MKKYFFLFAALLIIGTATTQVVLKGKKDRNANKARFTVKEGVVYYDSKPLARYQAKTYSLDNNELVEEYNLILVDSKLREKQLIGDLIDFVSDRHKGAEVEVEIDAKDGLFDL